MRTVRISFMIASLLWFIYNLHVGAIMPMVGNIFEVVSGLIALIRFKDK